jgi:hypothetical protein
LAQAKYFENSGRRLNATLFFLSPTTNTNEILSIVVFWDFFSGGFLHDSIDKFLSFQEVDDVLMSVELSPILLG